MIRARIHKEDLIVCSKHEANIEATMKMYQVTLSQGRLKCVHKEVHHLHVSMVIHVFLPLNLGR